MKYLPCAFGILLLTAMSTSAQPHVDQLKTLYRTQGDDLFVALYWLPETSEIVRSHIPGHDDWVGFEFGLWKKLEEHEKEGILENIGLEFGRMEPSARLATWNRIRDWPSLRFQLSLMATFTGSEEEFLDLAHDETILQTAYLWIKDRRPPDFDMRNSGSTLSSGEMASFYPKLVEELLKASESERSKCFSRLFAKIAQKKSSEEVSKDKKSSPEN